MSEIRNPSNSPLSEAGEVRRCEILSNTNVAMSALKRKRSHSRLLFASLCGLIAGSLTWTILSNYAPSLKNDIGHSKSLATGAPNIPGKSNSVFEPMVENNRSGLVEKHVVQKVELQSTKIDFEAIDNTQLDELLVENGEEFVVGRIAGELRVLFVTDL